MLRRYKLIGQAIQEQVNGLRWIDVDKGQLDDPKAFNSLVVPALLIGGGEIDWTQQADRNRLGDCQIILKTVVTLPTQTHLTHPLFEKNIDHALIGQSVEDAMLSIPGVLACVHNNDYFVGTYYVMESHYVLQLKDGPSYINKEVALKINPFLFHPNQSTPNA